MYSIGTKSASLMIGRIYITIIGLKADKIPAKKPTFVENRRQPKSYEMNTIINERRTWIMRTAIRENPNIDQIPAENKDRLAKLLRWA